MAQQNPLNINLKPPKEKPKEVPKNNHCLRCNSTKLTEVSSFGGTGKSCNKCHYFWQTGYLGNLSNEEIRQYNDISRRAMEEELVKISPDVAMSASEYEQVTESIERNYQLLQDRIGDY